MTTPLSSHSAAGTYVIVPGVDADWALPMTVVEAIASAREWDGELLDVEDAVGLRCHSDDRLDRVLLVRVGGKRLGLRAPGAITTRHIPVENILNLPSMSLPTDRARALAALVVDGEKPLFILDLPGLGRLSRAEAGTSPPMST